MTRYRLKIDGKTVKEAEMSSEPTEKTAAVKAYIDGLRALGITARLEIFKLTPVSSYDEAIILGVDI